MSATLRGLATAIAIVGLGSCGPRAIETGRLSVSNDFRGVTDQERLADEWAAFSITLEPEDVAKIDQGQFTNPLLVFFPCDKSIGADAYLAPGYLDGRLVAGTPLTEHSSRPVTFTSYLYASRTFRLPPNLAFHRLAPSNQPHPANAP